MESPRDAHPYRHAPSRHADARPAERRGAAVVVAVCTWLAFIAARSPIVLLGAMALTVPAVARRIE